jgi:hypothetical protein
VGRRSAPAGGARGGPAQSAGRRGRLTHSAGELLAPPLMAVRSEGEGVNKLRVFSQPLRGLYLSLGAPTTVRSDGRTGSWRGRTRLCWAEFGSRPGRWFVGSRPIKICSPTHSPEPSRGRRAVEPSRCLSRSLSEPSRSEPMRKPCTAGPRWVSFLCPHLWAALGLLGRAPCRP